VRGIPAKTQAESTPPANANSEERQANRSKLLRREGGADAADDCAMNPTSMNLTARTVHF
jgi:hypothetical protein